MIRYPLHCRPWIKALCAFILKDSFLRHAFDKLCTLICHQLFSLMCFASDPQKPTCWLTGATSFFFSPVTDLCRKGDGEFFCGGAGVCGFILLWIHEWLHICFVKVEILFFPGQHNLTLKHITSEKTHTFVECMKGLWKRLRVLLSFKRLLFAFQDVLCGVAWRTAPHCSIHDPHQETHSTGCRLCAGQFTALHTYW